MDKAILHKDYMKKFLEMYEDSTVLNNILDKYRICSLLK